LAAPFVVGGAGVVGIAVVLVLSATWLRTPQVIDIRDADLTAADALSATATA
jgi:hypothetical protein